MNQQMAIKILANVLGWDNDDAREYVRTLENFAELKYDQYQQYEAGSRFLESISVWLNQFETIEEKKIAFQFVIDNLIFISQEEMHHLVASIYPDIIKPILKRHINEISQYNVITDKEYKKEMFRVLMRQSLILGLSDGARLDVLRRSSPTISNEQVYITYELPEQRVDDINKEMLKDTSEFYKSHNESGLKNGKIYHIFLLDDFSGSGISYLRQEEIIKDSKTSIKWNGKICKAIDSLSKSYKNFDDVRIHLILYLATEEAKKNIEDNLQTFKKDKKMNIEVNILQIVTPFTPSKELVDIMIRYHNKQIEDSHYLKGKYDKPYLGFNEGSLPLVIYHNTPNNSFPIIWGLKKSLFPRVTRHKDVN